MLPYAIIAASISVFLAIFSIFIRNVLLVATTPKWNRKSILNDDSPLVPHPPVPPELAMHTYDENGLLAVNPNGQHPIIELISRAEAEWRKKLDGASKTLEDAVAEYQRRYQRPPPIGFDAWWNYVQEHNVTLPDEYDQINRDLEPYWALDPLELQKLILEEQAVVETYTVGKEKPDDSISVLNHSFADPEHWKEKNALRGAQDIIDLLKDVELHLPSFHAVVSPMDNPMLLTDYRAKDMLLRAASRNKTVPLSDLPKAEPKNLQLACAPSSPAYKYGVDYSKPPPMLTKGSTFIWDHRLAMDPCTDPTIFYQHGEYLGLDERHIPPQGMKPRFADCSTLVHHDIQLPTLLGWVEDLDTPSDDPEWEDKPDQRMSWRGSNTGMWFAQDGRWRSTQRTRLVKLANDVNGTVDVLLPNRRGGSSVGPGLAIDNARINPALFDIAFAGQPIDCDPGVCDELNEMFDWRRRQSLKEAAKFKYIFDMDGNAWSSRFKRLITSKSLIFKATIYPEWFFDRIQPWVHYVPVQMDLSDLHNAFLFFHGGLYGEGAHDDAARRIAYAGREWSKTFWRKEDMTAYLFRLFLEYARVVNVDRHSLCFKVA